MNHQFKLSICMMVKDEEKNLTRCLESLKPLVDEKLAELIILDTGSKDATIDIAYKYTDKVYFHQWNKNFSDMRNISISYAKGKWIFIIDADERLDNSEELINILKSSKIQRYNTITLKVKNLTNPKDETHFAVNISPRIFRNDGYFKYVGAVHNQPLYKEPILNLNIHLTHFGYILSDKKLMDKKYQRTKEILESELAKDQNNIYYRFQLGVTYDMHGDKKEALEEFRKAYRLLNQKSRRDKCSQAYVYGSYARSAFQNGKYQEVIEICHEGIQIRQDYIDLYYLISYAYKTIGCIDKSTEYFLKYIELVNNFDRLEISKDMTINLYNIDILSKSGVCLELSKYYLEIEDYNLAHQYAKFIDNVMQKTYMLIKILIKLQRYEELRELYEALDDKKEKDNFITTLEMELSKGEEEENIRISKEFSKCNDLYGIFNNIRLKSGNEKFEEIKKFLSIVDFNDAPICYYKIFEELLNKPNMIINSFRNIMLPKLRTIVNLLVENNDKFNDMFEDYLICDKVRPGDTQGNRVYIAISAVMLVKHLEVNADIDDKYYSIFESYIEKGIDYISNLYRIEKSRVIYNEINFEEDKFFAIMHIVKEYINKKNDKVAIKYLKKALSANNLMAKYIDMYIDKYLYISNKGDIYEL